jgi:hypothetical protein
MPSTKAEPEKTPAQQRSSHEPDVFVSLREKLIHQSLEIN